MSMSSLAMVNQKLAYCRAVMAFLDSQPEATNASQRLQHQALLDAGAFHLLCAYHHYLRELGENYMLPQVSGIDTEDDLEKALAAQGKAPAELRELQELSRRPGTWLQALNASYEACWHPADVSVSPDPGRIQTVDLDAPAVGGPVTRQKLTDWYREFNDMVGRQRDSSAEW